MSGRALLVCVMLVTVSISQAQVTLPQIKSIVNAASFNAGNGAAPGSLVSLFGENLGTSTVAASGIPLPTSLGEVSVLINDTSVPLLYVSSGQINLQIPWGILAGSTSGVATVVVRAADRTSAPYQLPIVATDPGIFSVAFGTGPAIAINADGSLAATPGTAGPFPAQPARIGSTLMILATGLGALDTAVSNGANSLDQLRRTLAAPEVLIGRRPARVLFSGLSPEFPGVNQINVEVLGSVEPGAELPLQIRLPGTTSSDLPFIAVRLPNTDEVSEVQILPPEPERRLPVNVDPSALPTDARAHFPALDSDPIHVTLPARPQENVSAKEIFATTIAPILRSIEFTRGSEGLRFPPEGGVEQPAASLAPLAQASESEFVANPELIQPATLKMLDAMAGRISPDDQIDQAFLTGEGMTFSQYVAGIERRATLFPFQQVEGNVVIEHAGLAALRWQGQNVTTVYGSLINHYRVVNRVRISVDDALNAATTALAQIEGISRITCTRPEEGPTLLLLPYGSDSDGVMRLHNTYRMILTAMFYGRDSSFQIWLDTDSGLILKLLPLTDSVRATGITYNRDPGVGRSVVSSFEVDAASGGQYMLQRAGVMNRVLFKGNRFDPQNLSILASGTGSRPNLANFNQPPINLITQARCASGTNKAFQQVNVFGTISRHYEAAIAHGIFTPFPRRPWTPKVESRSAGCNSWSDMDFGVCQGYTNAACPNYSDGTSSITNSINFALDNTMIAHEVGHNLTKRLTNTRPVNWCGTASCALPAGWVAFHDLADFWADHFESTNCIGGWVSKNVGGVNAGLNCAGSDEGDSLPRLHSVTVPFNPATPGDHFPEHRALDRGVYAEGQIAAAALWQIRLGMRSKSVPSGTPQFEVRFARALKNTGVFAGAVPSVATDLGLYRYLYDLGLKLTEEWATSGSPSGALPGRHIGAHTTNKVMAGFAKVGLFLIPYQCLDGNARTTDATSCPTGENGGDAVIDIDDNDPVDDLRVNNVVHPEVDYLRSSGAAPTFHVWTGPRYRLSGANGSSTFTNPSPCNSRFQVEVSTDPTFPAASTIYSVFIPVDVDPATSASSECYGTWTPTTAEWGRLRGQTGLIYYRARTTNAAGGNSRLSTTPGNGLWTVPPAYAVITSSGRSDH